MMKEISLEMVRDHMDHLPSYSCPSDYTIRTFVRGDERLWAKIESLAGEFPNQEQALEHFKAVNLYLNFGFVPYLGNDSGKEGWLLMEQVLHRKIL